jgi:hypothetical protein
MSDENLVVIPTGRNKDEFIREYLGIGPKSEGSIGDLLADNEEARTQAVGKVFAFAKSNGQVALAEIRLAITSLSREVAAKKLGDLGEDLDSVEATISSELGEEFTMETEKSKRRRAPNPCRDMDEAKCKTTEGCRWVKKTSRNRAHCAKQGAIGAQRVKIAKEDRDAWNKFCKGVPIEKCGKGDFEFCRLDDDTCKRKLKNQVELLGKYKAYVEAHGDKYVDTVEKPKPRLRVRSGSGSESESGATIPPREGALSPEDFEDALEAAGDDEWRYVGEEEDEIMLTNAPYVYDLEGEVIGYIDNETVTKYES